MNCILFLLYGLEISKKGNLFGGFGNGKKLNKLGGKGKSSSILNCLLCSTYFRFSK